MRKKIENVFEKSASKCEISSQANFVKIGYILLSMHISYVTLFSAIYRDASSSYSSQKKLRLRKWSVCARRKPFLFDSNQNIHLVKVKNSPHRYLTIAKGALNHGLWVF